jgi:adenine deaminase
MSNSTSFSVSGKIVDVIGGRIFRGTIHVENAKIKSITEGDSESEQYIMPGFIDAHIHIESSMLIPSEFARLAVVHGTVATVSDPHEIANVLGIEGVNFMINNGKKTPFKFYFGAPSCVPATSFESSGATLGIKETEKLLKSDDISYLAEMMNFPGVLFEDSEVMAKLALAKKYGKKIDGHAPGLKGDDARKYVNAGITTDHECVTMEEAVDKINFGMEVLIREGSAAKNFEALVGLLDKYANHVMFCSDDKHPDELEKNHMNVIAKRAVVKGYDVFKVIRALSYNPVKHYNLNVGLVQPGDDADFIIVDNLVDFGVIKTYIKGELVAEKGKSLIPPVFETPINKFNCSSITCKDIEIEAEGDTIKVIEAYDGQLITGCIECPAKISNGHIVSDTENDILKIVVINRYQPSKPAVGFIRNIGLKRGAIASTVAHDSHNIISVGADDESIVKAINLVIENKGGISVIGKDNPGFLGLPVAGLMSNEDGHFVAKQYKRLDKMAKELGTKLPAPFMTLSFMALLVLPELKLSDKGLFDGKKFEFTSLIIK